MNLEHCLYNKMMLLLSQRFSNCGTRTPGLWEQSSVMEDAESETIICTEGH